MTDTEIPESEIEHYPKEFWTYLINEKKCYFNEDEGRYGYLYCNGNYPDLEEGKFEIKQLLPGNILLVTETNEEKDENTGEITETNYHSHYIPIRYIYGFNFIENVEK
jgi:hypothetical protein